jgi:serine/threonine protein kinase
MDPTDDKNIQIELVILKEANHPFSIKYIEEFEYKKKDKLCVVTQFVNGGNLYKLIEEKALSED